MNAWRKYSLSVGAGICAFALCWTGKLSGQEWVYAQVLILGADHAAAVMADRTTPGVR